MTARWLRSIRFVANPRSWFQERGAARPPRASTIILGIDTVDTILLVLTFVVSMLTFAVRRTNVLLGAVHLLLFLAYLMLIFEK